MSCNGGKAGGDHHVFMRQVTHPESTNMVNPGHGCSGDSVGCGGGGDDGGFDDKATIKTIRRRRETLTLPSLPCHLPQFSGRIDQVN